MIQCGSRNLTRVLREIPMDSTILYLDDNQVDYSYYDCYYYYDYHYYYYYRNYYNYCYYYYHYYYIIFIIIIIFINIIIVIDIIIIVIIIIIIIIIITSLKLFPIYQAKKPPNHKTKEIKVGCKTFWQDVASLIFPLLLWLFSRRLLDG